MIISKCKMRKIIILPLILILSSLLVNSQLANLDTCWGFNSFDNSIFLDDQPFPHNNTVTSNAVIAPNSFVSGGMIGLNPTDVTRTIDNTNVGNTSDWKNMSIVFWQKSLSYATEEMFFNVESINLVGKAQSGTYRFQWADASSGSAILLNNFAHNDRTNWNQFAFTISDTNATLYLNGTQVDSQIISGNVKIGGEFDFLIGTNGNDAFMNGNIDEMAVFNKTLTPEEVNNLWLGTEGLKTGTNCSSITNLGSDVTPPTVTIENPTPSNNSFINTILPLFNITATDDSGVDFVIVELNGTNETGFSQNGNTWTKTINTLGEGHFAYIVYATDTIGNEFTSGTFEFTVDNTFPEIFFNFPLSDNSTRSTLNNNLNIQGINLNLNQSNLTITNSSNEIIFQNITTDIGFSTFTFTNALSEMFTTQPDGVYTANVCFIDHALNENCGSANITIDRSVDPIITQQSNTSPEVGLPVQFNATCTDESLITQINVTNNITGTQSVVASVTIPSILTLKYIFNHTAVDGTIAHQFTCEDSIGNTASSAELIYTSRPSTSIPLITGAVISELPLENAVNVAGIIVLFLVVTGLFLKFFKDGKG